MSMRPLLGLLAICAAVAGSALGVGGAAASTWGPGPLLLVDATGDEYPELDVSLEFGDEGAPGRISLFVPSGFAVYPVRPPGRPVGQIVIAAASYAGTSASASFLYGNVAAAPLDAATEAAAQSCSPGSHVAVWRASLSLLGRPFDLPMYVAPPAAGDPADAQLRIDLCAPALPPGDALLPMLSLALQLPDLESPRAPGSYTWRALVTPLAPDQSTLLPEKAYELRSLIPVPHRLTLKARYVARQRVAILEGRLTASGQPRAGVAIEVIRLVRKVTPRGVVFSDSVAGAARTGRRGAFALRVKMPRTAGFIAFARQVAGRCSGASTAPGGCLAMTIGGTASETVTVHVPGRG